MKTWLVALLFASTAYAAQEDESVPAPAPVNDGVSFTAGGGYSLWIAPFDFEASGPAFRFDRDSSLLGGFAIFGRLDLDETWALQADADFSFGTEIGVTVLGLGGVYRFGLLEDPWDTHLRASILYGRIEDSEVPGDFDPGFGFELGGGVDYSLGELIHDGLHARVDVMGRYLEFEFDADPGITSDDGETGGFGIRLMVGLEYRF